jgi:TonB family protein
VEQGPIRIMTNFGLVAAPATGGPPVPAEEAPVRPQGVDVLGALDGIDRPLGFYLEDARLPALFEALHHETGWDLVVEGILPPLFTTFDARGRTARRLLEDLAQEVGLAYEVAGPRSLLVRGPWIAGMDGTSYPELVARADPAWPERARSRGAHGKVLLEGVVRSDGRVGALRLLRGVEGWPDFGESALAAMGRWRYRPAFREGRPVSTFLVVVVEFPPSAAPRREEALVS